MPDILLSSFVANRIRTSGGNAVAADINSGKTALVNGLKIVGTTEVKPLPAQNGILAYVRTPISINDNAFNPAMEHGAVQIQSTAFSSVSSASDWVLSHYGWAYNAVTSYANFYSAIPPAYTTRRKFEFWGLVQDTALTNAHGVRILFNYIDGNNYWQVDLRWSTGSGAFYVTIWEVTASVGTTRATINFSTALDLPARWHLIVYEQGDAIVVQCWAYEADVITDDFAVSIYYTVASRPRKNTGLFAFSTQGGIVGASWLIMGCRITDLL